MSVKRTSLQKYRLRKAIEYLKKKEGRGTELISLYVPPGRSISEVVNMLRQEYGTASNIKSTTTRKNVQDAIVKVMQRLKLFSRVPENGLVIFCGSIPQNGPGSEKIETYVIVPPEPISIYLYRCDSRFHTEYLEEFLKERENYGILVFDAGSATFAILSGKRVEIVREITSGVPGKTRAGGQSARRFERIREAKILEYFKRVAKHANEIFLSVPDLKGIIIGGPGPTKYDFEKGEYLHYSLRDKVLATIDTAYVGEQGVKEMLEKAPEILRKVRCIEEKRLIQRFLYHLGHDTGLAIYGERDVRRFLEAGAVETLLLSEGLEDVRVNVKCSSCGYEYQETLKRRDLIGFEKEISAKQCPKCSNISLHVENEVEVIEELAELGEKAGSAVEIISTETEEGKMLLESFGGIAAILRYKP
ncbi:peptide chain release factor aRF-1 [Candidatus Bathyarchaeota archaeon]|nr:peptide chain release factor aRF-1 [Candidatus Bathyarchaeota archaeon]